MKKQKIILFSLILISTLTLLSSCASKGTDMKITIWETELKQITQMQQSAIEVHPLFTKLYPIALVDGEEVYIFEELGGEYKFKLKKKASRPYPNQIRAAFPMQENDFKMTCVVSPDALNKQSERILIFHEFVHCFQMETCEMELKENLSIYTKAMAEKDYMWEINYAFSYDNPEIWKSYKKTATLMEAGKLVLAKQARIELMSMLSDEEKQYLVWQEWKEGFARFIENELRMYFRTENNDYGWEQDFSRITFYAGGERMIRALVSQDIELQKDLKRLYEEMVEFGE